MRGFAELSAIDSTIRGVSSGHEQTPLGTIEILDRQTGSFTTWVR